MHDQLAYLKSVIEGADNIERWTTWFERNDAALSQHLSRGLYLRLKLSRINAVPEVLTLFGIPFTPSDRYAWLAGVENLCRDCGATIERTKWTWWCPNGCFHVSSDP